MHLDKSDEGKSALQENKFDFAVFERASFPLWVVTIGEKMFRNACMISNQDLSVHRNIDCKGFVLYVYYYYVFYQYLA